MGMNKSVQIITQCRGQVKPELNVSQSQYAIDRLNNVLSGL